MFGAMLCFIVQATLLLWETTTN